MHIYVTSSREWAGINEPICLHSFLSPYINLDIVFYLNFPTIGAWIMFNVTKQITTQKSKCAVKRLVKDVGCARYNINKSLAIKIRLYATYMGTLWLFYKYAHAYN